jgi:hypothetical protein
LGYYCSSAKRLLVQAPCTDLPATPRPRGPIRIVTCRRHQSRDGKQQLLPLLLRLLLRPAPASQCHDFRAAAHWPSSSSTECVRGQPQERDHRGEFRVHGPGPGGRRGLLLTRRGSPTCASTAPPACTGQRLRRPETETFFFFPFAIS